MIHQGSRWPARQSKDSATSLLLQGPQDRSVQPPQYIVIAITDRLKRLRLPSKQPTFWAVRIFP